MHKNYEKIGVLAGLLITGIVFSVLAFVTVVPEGGADNFAHFNIARWAFRYPHLFLDHWGKPVFTILSAPFSLFGFQAVRILNSVLGLLTAWYTWKLAKIFGFENSWFSVIVVIFTPIYFVMMSTGMTEIIFSFIVVFSIYLFFKEKYFWATIVISFIFLARTEGLAFLLIFLTGLIIRKQYRIIPFLATGFLVFSVIGAIYFYHDFFWLINQRPYAKGGPSVYGRGEWNHFIKVMPNYFGETIRVLLAIGSISLIMDWILGKMRLNSHSFLLIIFILGAFWGYFFIHSYLWWVGETSAGLQRVMAGVSPLVGLIALFGIEKVFGYFSGKWVKIGILIILSAFLVYNGTRFYYQSVNYDLSAEIQSRVTKWLKDSGNLKHKMVMHNPYFAFSTEVDAWDNNIVQYGFSNNDKPESGLPDSTIFIWDAHFSANEGQLPFEKIMNNPNFEIIKLFEPVVPFKVLGNNDYKIVIFRKINNSGANNQAIFDRLKKDHAGDDIYYRIEYNFDRPSEDQNTEKNRVAVESDSINFCYSLSGAEFSPSFVISEKEILKSNENKFIIKADFCVKDSIDENRLLIVFSVESGNKSDFYATQDVCEQISLENVWYSTEFVFGLPEKIRKGSMIKIYVWNIDKHNVLMDKFSVEISKKSFN